MVWAARRKASAAFIREVRARRIDSLPRARLRSARCWYSRPVVLVLAAIAVGFALHSVGLAEIFFGFVLIAFGTRGMSAAFVYESSYSRVAVIGGSGLYRRRECAGKQSQHCEDFDKTFHRAKVVFFSFGRASVLP